MTLIAKDPPFVPTPAPALISPVGCSATFISIIFKLLFAPLDTLEFTFLKIFLDFIFAIDLSNFI